MNDEQQSFKQQWRRTVLLAGVIMLGVTLPGVEQAVYAATLPLNESFDATAVGQLPPNWSVWSFNNAVVAVSADMSTSGSNDLKINAPASSSAVRAWYNTMMPADAQSSVNIYLGYPSLPVYLFARGTNINSASPTFYSASMDTKGLQASLYKVINGVQTSLGTINTNGWTSDLWIRMTLYVNGDNLRLQIVRNDTLQYLNAQGDWQNAKTWALNLTDSSITAEGNVGIGMPAAYVGTIQVDDFNADTATGDKIPPVVSITSPATGTTLKGTVTINSAASDASGISKVEYYVDGDYKAAVLTTTGSTYGWAFNTVTAQNGAHTITARAYDTAENISENAIQISTNNDTAVTRPTFPKPLSWIRISQEAYEGTPFTTNIIQNVLPYVSYVNSNQAYATTIKNNQSAIQITAYDNISNIYTDLLTDWLSYADAHGLSREGAFFHVIQPMPFAGDSPSSLPVNKFWTLYKMSGSASNYMWNPPYIFGDSGESVAFGYPDKFREVNFNLQSGASGGWHGVLEYPKTVDANGTVLTWGSMPLLSDTTNNWGQSGKMLFDPPADWVAGKLPNASANNSALYYLRIKTLTGGTVPIETSILGADFVGANGTTTGVIPVFDQAADANNDGYLTDAEYATRAAGRDARFFYQSRWITESYGQMRFSANVANEDFRQWAVDFAKRLLTDMPLYDGIMMDNTSPKAPINGQYVMEPVANYDSNQGALLNAIWKGTGKFVIANVFGNADNIIALSPAAFIEFYLRPLSDTNGSFLEKAEQVDHLSRLTSPLADVIVDSHPQGDIQDAAGVYAITPRLKISTLAEYYLVSTPSTMLNFYGGYEPATDWSTRHWSKAVLQDVGQPAEALNEFARGADPSNSANQYIVYQRHFSKALVFYKPLPTGGSTTADASKTTHALGGNYQILSDDGTLSSPVTSVDIRNGEGVILISSTTSPSDPTPPSAPANANITADHTSGVAPLAVAFTASASGTSPSYSWNFGDGSTGSGAFVSHSFVGAGSYTVTLTATNSAGSASAIKTITVTAPAPVVSAPTAATITASASSGVAPLSVSFTGAAQGSNLGTLTYSWVFGDNTTGSGASVSHSYSAAGIYTATVVASNSVGSASATNTISVTAPPPIVTALSNLIASADKTSGVAPLAVAFTASASGTSPTYSWNFGDGSTGSGASTSHSYSVAGSYTATVTASNSAGNVSKSVTITVTAPAPVLTAPSALTASADKTSGVAPLAVNFTASASGTTPTYSWTFGDGSTGSGATTSHSYSTAGSYTATVTASNSAGTVSKTVTVTVTAPPIVQNVPPTANPTWKVSNSRKHQIQFTANAKDPDTATKRDPDGKVTYKWAFGDNTTSTNANPDHTYAKSGTYTVTLTVTDIAGATVTKTITVTVP